MESSQTFAVDFFCGNRQFIKTIGYFDRRAPSWNFDSMFDRILNAALLSNVLQLGESRMRSFSPLELHKGTLDSPCLIILLIYANNNENSSSTYIDKANMCN